MIQRAILKWEFTKLKLLYIQHFATTEQISHGKDNENTKVIVLYKSKTKQKPQERKTKNRKIHRKKNQNKTFINVITFKVCNKI